MIYYFGTGDKVSMVVNEKYLTEAQRQTASLVVDAEIEPEVREGFKPVRYIDPVTNNFKWNYREIVVVVSQENKLQLLVDSGILTQEQMDDLLK